MEAIVGVVSVGIPESHVFRRGFRISRNFCVSLTFRFALMDWESGRDTVLTAFLGFC